MTYADGTPAFLVADTAWAMPFRATLDDVAEYARDRAAKGFNAVFLMTVQPDMDAVGPTGRNVDGGFEVGFHDLPSGHLNKINIDYFRYFDRICDVLLGHGITPVLQPVFHGYGWKGQRVAGPVVPPEEVAGGIEVHTWDDYAQPTGLHYRPHSRSRAHQDADWLDFQSCQTGHDGDHVPDRLATMWMYQPVKAIMNGEPTYENSGRYWIIDPTTASVVESGIRPPNYTSLPGPDEVPGILICADVAPAVVARQEARNGDEYRVVPANLSNRQ